MIGVLRKSWWPELVGANGVRAAAVIESENPTVKATIVTEGTTVGTDFRKDRVWVKPDLDIATWPKIIIL
ncbi:hypothetical protein AMTRI_Chr03g54130 [Amborella trichopoda]